MSMPDWRSSAAYEDAEHVPLRGLAWEYLRRNKNYARIYHRSTRVPDADPADISARRWGLRFPDRPGPVGRDSVPVLAADRAAYLRAMHDRFGAPGFLAAYNAGPARYQAFLSSGRPLPPETRIYLARLAPLLGIEQPFVQQAAGAPDPLAWTRSPVFVVRSNRSESIQSRAMVAHSDNETKGGFAAAETSSKSPQDHAARVLPDSDTLKSGRLFVHSKLETTALYAKVSTRTIHAVTGPLDRLMALMEGKTPPE